MSIFDFAGSNNPPDEAGTGTPVVPPPVSLPSVAQSPVEQPPTLPAPVAPSPMPDDPRLAAVMAALRPKPVPAWQEAIRKIAPILGALAAMKANAGSAFTNSYQGAEAASQKAEDEQTANKLKLATILHQQMMEKRQFEAQQLNAQREAVLEKYKADLMAFNQRKLDAANTASANRLAASERLATQKAQHADWATAWSDFQKGGGVDEINKQIDEQGSAAVDKYLASTNAPGLPGVSLKELFSKHATFSPDGKHYIGGRPLEKDVLGSEADILQSYARDVVHKPVAQLTYQDRLDAFAKVARSRKVEDADDAIQLTPAGLDLTAKQYAMTGQLPAMGFGKKASAIRERIINHAASVYEGLDLPSQIAAYNANKQSLAQIQRQTDALSAFQRTAGANLETFLTTAKKVIDTGSPWINQPLRTVSAQGMGSADMAAFNAARQVVLPEFSRIISNPNLTGVLSDTARDEINALLKGNATLPQIYAVTQILLQDSKNRSVSYQQQIRDIQKRIATPPGQGRDDFDLEFDPATGQLKRKQ